MVGRGDTDGVDVVAIEDLAKIEIGLAVAVALMAVY
jgi:hypothetical protein